MQLQRQRRGPARETNAPDDSKLPERVGLQAPNHRRQTARFQAAEEVTAAVVNSSRGDEPPPSHEDTKVDSLLGVRLKLPASGGFCRAATKQARVQRATESLASVLSLRRSARRYLSQRDKFYRGRWQLSRCDNSPASSGRPGEGRDAASGCGCWGVPLERGMTCGSATSSTSSHARQFQSHPSLGALVVPCPALPRFD